ncbi:MAG: GntR family transcriptional regulator [Christensenellales bacterium]
MTEKKSPMVQDNRPVRDNVYETLKNAILTGELPAGSRIIETQYAEKLHISRTPLREAFRRLEQDGLVSYEVRRGVVVRAFTVEDVEEIFTIRNALMVLIVPSIIEKVVDEDIADLREILARMDISQAQQNAKELAPLNRQFHRRLEKISGKKRILRTIDSQEEYIKLFSEVTIASIVARSTAHQEHHQMLQLLERRDATALEQLMLSHLESSKQTCLQVLEQKKSFFNKT